MALEFELSTGCDIKHAFEWNPLLSDGVVTVATTKHFCSLNGPTTLSLKNSFSYNGANF